MIGESPSFVDADAPTTISVQSDHPAIKPLLDAVKLLQDAVKHLNRDQPRAAVECMVDAMTAISVHDDLMCEF